MFLDPKKNYALKNDVQQLLKKYKIIFDRMDMTNSYEFLLSTLWNSYLPCFDVKNETSNRVGETAMLKYCEWQGKPMPCSALFTKVPTDQGFCCAFNTEAANEIFNEVKYSKIFKEMQNNDYNLALDSSTSRKPLDSKSLISQSGLSKGLRVVLDAHTDILASGSYPGDFKGFKGFISTNQSYPKVFQKGFLIRPGHINLVALSATKVEASSDIRSIEPSRRRCFFSDETSNLKIYKKYSQSNCYLECALQNARNEVFKKNISCTPWYYPTYEQTPKICNPWENIDFYRAIMNTSEAACQHCLPSCTDTYYHHTVTAQPFRRCDDLNFGVGKFCKLDDQNNLPDPQMWAQQIKDQFPESDFTFKMTSNIRKHLSKVFETNGGTLFANDVEYDAFEDDIAVVHIFFEPSAIFLYGTKPSQTWLDFLSSIGGLLGLCIGFSIITMIELFWLLIQIIFHLFQPFNRKPHRLTKK